jgi:hypothetical protein
VARARVRRLRGAHRARLPAAAAVACAALALSILCDPSALRQACIAVGVPVAAADRHIFLRADAWALTLGILSDPSALCLACVAVGLPVAAAHWSVYQCAEATIGRRRALAGCRGDRPSEASAADFAAVAKGLAAYADRVVDLWADAAGLGVLDALRRERRGARGGGQERCEHRQEGRGTEHRVLIERPCRRHGFILGCVAAHGAACAALPVRLWLAA